METQKVSDKSQKYKIIIFIAFFAVAILGYLKIVSILEGIKQGPIQFGGFSNIDIATSTVGSFTCGTTTSVAVPAYSGRVAFRAMWNTSGSIYLSLSTSATSNQVAVVNQGIKLSSSSPFFDFNQSGVNWGDIINCVSDVTGTVATYWQAR